MRMTKVLFVCLSNVCRSPMAEAIFLHLVKRRNLQDVWFADSAGVSNRHAGSKPHDKTIETLKKNGLSYRSRARQIGSSDFTEFDYILCMDKHNLADVEKEMEKIPEHRAIVKLLGEYDPEGVRVVQDPYFDKNAGGFEKCYEHCLRCCEAFLDSHGE